MRVQSALKSDRLCKSLTGLTALEFTQLVESFKKNLLEIRIKARTDRLRALGGDRIGKLVTVEDKLFRYMSINLPERILGGIGESIGNFIQGVFYTFILYEVTFGVFWMFGPTTGIKKVGRNGARLPFRLIGRATRLSSGPLWP